ncbi:3-phenylpropionate/trans-cinnamate dioxygenase ferredoxin subunit [Klenkia soli]|uniref:3-phenylpropionate/trans-cinnamate dioxygenase ferredoxin subunit n=1 Tax=Klenkia soli TaxID=1052260 RepID=A0A1H0S375_9ACTN|nr:non-heme iron oxygenase ferredoxin subunit [Klenkia soli]SDP36192.1 3-phenylpropionate/trans-cinnamate dioxygenase ferredoxin subunit [Klenkia soli]
MSYQRVCGLSDVADGEALPVSVGDLELVVARWDGEVYALTDLCSHQDYPLSDGDVELVDGVPTIECTWHGSCFDLRSGAPTNLPANKPVTTHPVRVEGDDIYVDVLVDTSAAEK